MLLDNRNSRTKNLTVEEIDATPEVKIDVEAPVVPVHPQTDTVVPVAEQTPEKTVDDVLSAVENEKPEKPKETEDDFKKRYADSSREAQNLAFKNQKLNSILSTDFDVPEPTVDELKKYAKENEGDYDEMDAFSRNVLKKQWMLEKKEEKRATAYNEVRKVELWSKKVDEFVESEENMAKYPSLDGVEKEFKDYCMKETQRGVDFNLLVASFLYSNEKLPEKKTKTPILLSQGNGRVETPKPAGLSASETEMIRTKDPKEYRRLIKAGKIKIEI